jgi:hypothetical protein
MNEPLVCIILVIALCHWKECLRLWCIYLIAWTIWKIGFFLIVSFYNYVYTSETQFSTVEQWEKQIREDCEQWNHTDMISSHLPFRPQGLVG